MMRTCEACGLVFEQTGPGRPRRWCKDHVPSSAESVREWRKLNAGRVREFNDSRRNSPVWVSCSECEKVFRAPRRDSKTCSKTCFEKRRSRVLRENPERMARLREQWRLREFTRATRPARGERGRLRRAVFDRDGGRCRYCGKLVGANWHLAHLVAKAKGGPDTLENLAVSCAKCNLSDGTGRLPVQLHAEVSA